MRKTRTSRSAIALGVMAVLAVPALAEEVTAVTADNTLITFDTASPLGITSSRPITGITGNVIGIDIRPADGQLFALTDAGRLYRLDASTGAATAVGSGPLSPAIVGLNFGMDFNPGSDRIRLVTDQDQNLRINPNQATVEDGDLATTQVEADAPLAYANTDPNEGVNPNAVALAFTNNFPGTSSTTAFVIDSNLDVLARLGDPDGSDAARIAGTLHTIGSLGVNTTGFAAFDVSRATGEVFAALTLSGEASSRLFSISLFTGAAVPIGQVGSNVPVVAMAIGPVASSNPTPEVGLVALTTAGSLERFNASDTTRILTRVAVTGLIAGDSLLAIDTRPSKGRLYGLGSGGRIYVINVDTGVATAIRETPFEIALEGTQFGFDFNAASDRIRIVSDSGQNFRVVPDTGAVVDGDAATPGIQGDDDLDFGAGDPNQSRVPNVIAIANGRNGIANATTLFGIDPNLDALVRQGSPGGQAESPNTGTLHTIGSLGVDTADLTGFEIAGDGTAFASLTELFGATRLFEIDLATGRATLIGDIGANERVRDIALAPTSNPIPGEDLRVRELTIRFDYRKNGGDSAKLRGSVPFPSGPMAGKAVTVDIGGFQKTFVLGERGKRRDGNGTKSFRDDDSFQFVGAPRDGRLKFVTSFRREELADDFADEDMDGASNARHARRTVRVRVTVDGITYTTDVGVRFAAKANNVGLARID